jgi:hypothetical protein
MSQVLNLTPFAAAVRPHTDADGHVVRLLIVKGVWDLDRPDRLSSEPGCLGFRDAPLMVRMADLALDPAQRAALGPRLEEEIEWIPSDVVPPKPRFDFIVSGYGYPRTGKAEYRFIAAVARHRQVAALTLCAPRFWRRTLLSGGGGVAGDFVSAALRVPVHPCFSFGGDTPASATPHNPQGMGGTAGHAGEALHRIALPWVEHPDHPVTDITGNPLPAGFGPWPENAGPRLAHMGTRDLAWQRERAPRPPQDFHPLFHNQADPRLQWPEAPSPGETIALHGLTASGTAQVVWPSARPVALLDTQTVVPLKADTCIVLPDEGRCAIVWRCLLPPEGHITLRACDA